MEALAKENNYLLIGSEEWDGKGSRKTEKRRLMEREGLFSDRGTRGLGGQGNEVAGKIRAETAAT